MPLLLTEGLVDRQVRLHHEHGGTYDLVLLEYMTSPLVEDGVDAAQALLRALDLHEVDWLK